MKKSVFLIFAISILILCVIISCSDEKASHTTGEVTSSSVTTAVGTTEHTHSYQTSVVPPSCTEGYTVYTCEGCGHSYTDNYTEALGHSYEVVSEDCACNVHITTKYTCTVCQYSYSETEEEYGTLHSMKLDKVIYPTREEGGYSLYKCENCDKEEKKNETSAVDFSVGLAYTQKSNGYYVSGLGACTDTDIIIPSVNEKGEKVIGVAARAFYNGGEKIKSIFVPTAVKSVEAYAFTGCNKLEELTISLDRELVEYFGDGISRGVPETLKTVNIVGNLSESASLSGARSLTKVTIADNIRIIPSFFFLDCENLSDISFSDKVTSFGMGAFYGSGIKEITVPRSITVLPMELFRNCSLLEKVTLHDNITEIGICAFSGCGKLKEITLPSILRVLGESAFYECASIEKIVIPKGVTEIPDQCFRSCTMLNDFQMHDGVTSMGYDALSGTALKEFVYPENMEADDGFLNDCLLLESVTFNDKLTRMYRFEGCSSLKRIVIPSGIKEIVSGAFEGCSSLSEVVIPDSVSVIGFDAFRGCSSLKSVTIPDGVKEIDSSTFEGCTSLESITIPDSVKIIGQAAFRSCEKLSNVKFPKSLTSIGQYAFRFSGIKKLDLSSLLNVVSIGKYAFAETLLEEVRLSENMTLTKEYIFEGCEFLKTLTVDEGVKRIPKYAFLNCFSLETVLLPSTVEVIEEQAFSGCTALTELTIPEGLTSVGASAFFDCLSVKTLNYNAVNLSRVGTFSSLTKITIGDKVETIPYQLCKDSAGITELSLPEGLKKICEGAFESCEGIEELVIPSTVEIIERDAFSFSGIKSLLFDSCSPTLGRAVFRACTRLSSVDFGNGVVTLGGDTFMGCSSFDEVIRGENVFVCETGDFPSELVEIKNGLVICFSTVLSYDMDTIETSVVIPEGIRFIAPDAFKDCGMIRSVTSHGGIEIIGDNAFSGCGILKNVTLGEGLRYIGEGSFAASSSLESVYLPDSLEKISSRLFAGCTSLSSLSLGAGLKEVADDFFVVSNNNKSLYKVTYRGTSDNWASVAMGDDNMLKSCTISCTDKDLVAIIISSNVYNSNCSYTVDSNGTLTLYGEGYFPLDFSVNNPANFRYVITLLISEGITGVNPEGLDVFERLENVIIPSTLEGFRARNLRNTPWYQKGIYDDNGFFIVNGVLFDVDTSVSGKVTVPDSVKYIGEYAFNACNLITEITVPSSVEKIGKMAFWNCTRMEKVNLAEGISVIDNQAFTSCNALTEVVIPRSVTLVRDPFAFCETLRKITFLGNTKVEMGIVAYCDALEIIVLGEGMNGFVENTVYSCPALKIVVVPSSFTEMDRRAFAGIPKTVAFCFTSPDNASAFIENINSWSTNYAFEAYIYEDPATEDDAHTWRYNENGDPEIIK